VDAGLAAIAGTLAGVAFTQVIQTLTERQRQHREDRRHWANVRREAYVQFMEAANRIAVAGGFLLDVIRIRGTIPDDLDVVMKAAAPIYGITFAELQHPLNPNIVTPSAFIDRFVKDLERSHNQIKLIGSPSANQKAIELYGFVFSNVYMKIGWATIATAAKLRKSEQDDVMLKDALKQLDESNIEQLIGGLTRRISEFEAAARSDLGV
jgi:hypothetical protein